MQCCLATVARHLAFLISFSSEDIKDLVVLIFTCFHTSLTKNYISFVLIWLLSHRIVPMTGKKRKSGGHLGIQDGGHNRRMKKMATSKF